jgi:hypothetical protein
MPKFLANHAYSLALVKAVFAEVLLLPLLVAATAMFDL